MKPITVGNTDLEKKKYAKVPSPMVLCTLLDDERDMLLSREMAVFCRLGLGELRSGDKWGRAPSF